LVRKLELTDYISSQHTYPTAQEIETAQDVVKQQAEALATSRKRKRVEPDIGTNPTNSVEGSVKRKKGAVEENSRRENEGMLQDLFTNT
jgi:hypothetical protein